MELSTDNSIIKIIYSMEKYIFNHFYTLRHDLKCSYIISSSARVDLPLDMKLNIGWITKIHPAYAMFLSFFSSPISIDKATEQISAFFNFPPNVIHSFIMNLIDAKEPTYALLDGHTSGFPINILIKESKEFAIRKRYNPTDFCFEELDFTSSRMFKAPMTIVFMPNNNCYTNCVYCYADKRKPQKYINFNVIEKFVKEAYELRIKDILITGGDFFLYKDWENILKLMSSYRYKPDLISTKVPLSSEIVDRFTKYNIRLQISFDTASPITAKQILNTQDGYIDKMIESLLYIDNHTSISYQISTVVTKYNATEEELDNLATFINKLRRIERWEIRIAFKSLYSKINFDKIKCTREEIIKIENWTKDHKSEIHTKLLWSADDDKVYRTAKGGSQNFEGARCSANTSNFVILPDGKVTICEQLYWAQEFIIGDINENTIQEIWNSPRALQLNNIKQSSIDLNSPCKQCNDFVSCFKFNNRCYVNIAKAYGFDKITFPDPRCCFAPAFINSICYEPDKSKDKSKI